MKLTSRLSSFESVPSFFKRNSILKYEKTRKFDKSHYGHEFRMMPLYSIRSSLTTLQRRNKSDLSNPQDHHHNDEPAKRNINSIATNDRYSGYYNLILETTTSTSRSLNKDTFINDSSAVNTVTEIKNSNHSSNISEEPIDVSENQTVSTPKPECCMSGCVNCVLLEETEIEQEDPSLKAFKELEASIAATSSETK